MAKETREERLARQLRGNLRGRKARARERANVDDAGAPRLRDVPLVDLRGAKATPETINDEEPSKS